jgi:hypothetical protein
VASVKNFSSITDASEDRGLLPALKLADGTVITHSKAILSWVADQP